MAADRRESSDTEAAGPQKQPDQEGAGVVRGHDPHRALWDSLGRRPDGSRDTCL